MSSTSVPIGDVCMVVGGGTPARHVPQYYGGDIPWVTPKDMKTWEIRDAQIKITKAGLENSATRLVPENSVLVVVRSGVLKHTIPVAISRTQVAINQDMKAFICAEHVDPDYLARFIKARSPEILQWVRATTADNFPIDKLKKLRMSLPPLPEQRRIAAILDKADALRAKRRAALGQLDTLTQSIFSDSFCGADALPTEPLESICELITDGTHYTPTYDENGTIFLSSKNVTSGFIDWNDVKYIPETLHRELHRRVAPRLNDVLLAKNGTTGVAAIVDRDCVFDIYVSLALLRPSKIVHPIFLREAINSPACKRQFDSSLKGIGVPNLHLKEIRRTRIPLPPAERQERFVRQVEEIHKQREMHNAFAANLDRLFASLQHRAFRAELSP